MPWHDLANELFRMTASHVNYQIFDRLYADRCKYFYGDYRIFYTQIHIYKSNVFCDIWILLYRMNVNMSAKNKRFTIRNGNLNDGIYIYIQPTYRRYY